MSHSSLKVRFSEKSARIGKNQNKYLVIFFLFCFHRTRNLFIYLLFCFCIRSPTYWCFFFFLFCFVLLLLLLLLLLCMCNLVQRVAELLRDDSATWNFSVGVLLVILVTPLKEREKRSTWKDGGKDTPEIQLKTAFIEIDGQPMMMMMMMMNDLHKTNQ